MNIKIVSIDFQNDFTAINGKCFELRPSVKFIKNIFIPYLFKKDIKIAEIISDYRGLKLSNNDYCCVPGSWGYKSEIPEEVRRGSVWIKCMNSPVWIKKNIGNSAKQSGAPYSNHKKFNEWVKKTIGMPKDVIIVLIGLTLDCCVLCAAQEFNFLGYDVKILEEGTDVYSGVKSDKEFLFKSTINNWASPITWEKLKEILD
jgi:nicotinamidase-related amidase